MKQNKITADYNTALKLSDIERLCYEKSGLCFRPFGRKYIELVRMIEDDIIAAGLEKSINGDVLFYLESWNAHTAGEAAHRVWLAMFEYAKEEEAEQ